MLDINIEKVLEPYRANVRNRDLIRQALRIAEKVMEDGFIYTGSTGGAEHFECPMCGAFAEITYKKGVVSNVAEMRHEEGCQFAAYEKLREEI